MANLALSADDFAKEIQVVMEERRMRTDDNPSAKLYEARWRRPMRRILIIIRSSAGWAI